MNQKRPSHIAVIDVGKTNAKLALVDVGTLTEIAVITRPNTVLTDGPYPHFDVEGHWQFFLENLRAFHQSHGIDAISITTHGASIVLLDDTGALATPMLDYEHPGPDDTAAAYDALRPPFAQTGAPRLPGGLNVGAQLHWLFQQDPSLLARTAQIISYPQYWGVRLTGKTACDVTSLGCHTDLWNPWTGTPSDLVDSLGIADKLAPALKSAETLGTITAEIARVTGLPETTPVAVGIHDSNASLMPHLSGTKQPFSVVSTGTWVICMAMGGDTPDLDPSRDILVNVNAHGDPVPSARFMGGREYELIRDGSTAQPTEADRAAVHAKGIMLTPSVVPHCGPYPNQTAGWTHPPETDGQRIYALSLYLALMSNTCLDLIGAAGTTVIEGPFARNGDFLAMLSVLRADPVHIATSATGTSIGAALLLTDPKPSDTTAVSHPASAAVLDTYAKSWQALVQH